MQQQKRTCRNTVSLKALQCKQRNGVAADSRRCYKHKGDFGSALWQIVGADDVHRQRYALTR